MNTTKQNKKIALFMDLDNEIRKYQGKYYFSDIPHFSTSAETKEEVIENIAEYSRYHKDWNWLMKVVEKINKEYSENIEIIIKYDQTLVLEYDHILSDRYGKTAIENTYNAVLDFIKETK